MPPASAVEVDGLVKAYGARRAVDGVSLAAPLGKVTAVIGPNGAGKTTTVEVCAGLRRRDAGAVRVLGLDPASDAYALRARVGVMPQASGSGACGVYPSARVGEVLRLYASYAASPMDPDALLDRLDLRTVVRTPWRGLSGGEQQRLSLALAIVARPDLVFLDEPTAGLDVRARHATWALVEDLRAAGVTVVLTTHAMDEAERLADHVVVISAGRVVAAGSPRELAARATAVVTFDAEPGLPVTDLAAALARASSAAPEVRETAPGRYAVSGAADPATVAAIGAWCAQRGVLADRITTRAGLEEVYLALTGGDA